MYFSASTLGFENSNSYTLLITVAPNDEKRVMTDEMSFLWLVSVTPVIKFCVQIYSKWYQPFRFCKTSIRK